MTRPLASTELKVWGKYSVKVKMWRNTKEVGAAYRTGGRAIRREEQILAFYGWETVNGKWRGTNSGTLNFAIDAIGSGIVAHEIQHVVMRWCVFMGWDFWAEIDSPYHEKIAELTERLTTQFWKWFYKNFE